MAKEQKQRDVDAFRVKKNIEQREERKQSKYQKPRHYDVFVDDESDADDDEYMHLIK